MLSESEIAELACSYAALILHDDSIPITADKINSLLKAANVNIPPYWAGLFARVLEKRNVEDLILSAGGSGSGPAPAPASVTSAAPVKQEEKKDDKKKKEEEKKKEESEEDLGFGLFD